MHCWRASLTLLTEASSLGLRAILLWLLLLLELVLLI